MNNGQRPWYFSTWFIIIMFFVFWPAALGLLIYRNSKNKSALFMGTTDRNKYIIGGVVLAIIGLARIKTTFGVIMLIGGVVLFIYSAQLAKKSERNRKYIDLIVNLGETSIDNIASVCNVPYETALKEIKFLQTVAVLNNVVIDEAARSVRKVAAPQQNAPSDFEQLAGMLTGGSSSPEMVTCTCPGCGAKVALPKGSTTNCEYCDSPITAK